MTAVESREITRLYRSMFSRLIQKGTKAFNGNRSLAEEALQETFQIACSKTASVCSSPSPEGWITVTFQNVIWNMIRQQARAHELLKLISVNYTQKPPPREPLDYRFLYEDLVNTEEFRLLSEMVLDGKSQSELAHERNISVDACKKRVQRAKEFMKQKITEFRAQD